MLLRGIHLPIRASTLSLTLTPLFIKFSSYGSVYKAKHRDTSFIIAIKVISTQEEAISDIEKEINILKQCKSSNIVSYYGTCIKAQQLWVCEFIVGKQSERGREHVLGE